MSVHASGIMPDAPSSIAGARSKTLVFKWFGQKARSHRSVLPLTVSAVSGLATNVQAHLVEFCIPGACPAKVVLEQLTVLEAMQKACEASI